MAQLNKLTDPKCKSAKPKDKTYSLGDGGGLRLYVYPTGTKSWRYPYEFGGKSKSYSIGEYPAISLRDAREKRSELKQLISEGVDPNIEKRYAKTKMADDTFQIIAERWFTESRPDWSAGHYNRESRALINDAFPFIGHRRIGEISIGEIIDVLKRISNRGALDSSKRMKYRLSQVYDYALNYELCTVNKARVIDFNQLKIEKHTTKHFAAITDPDTFGALMRDIDEYKGGVSVLYALKLSPYLAMRPSELTGGRWSEIDFDAAEWTLPAARRKLPTHIKRQNKDIDALVIPLPAQAVDIMRDLYEYTGRNDLMFPGQRGEGRSLSENAIRVALRSMGYSNEDHTGHGFRSSFSTIMNDLDYRDKVIIDAILGHTIKTDVESAYNRSKYLDEKRRVLQRWADYITQLKNGGNVLQFKRKA